MPGGLASSRRRSSSSGTLCPDGLLGLATNTMSGLRSLTDATATSMSRLKSAARLATSHAVWVPSAMIGCIEYDGTNPMRAAAGPAERLQQLLQDLVGTVGGPKVFDAQLRPGLRARGTRPGRCAAPPRRGRDSGAGRWRRSRPAAVDVVDQCLRRRMRVLVGVEPHRNVNCGAP